MRPRPVALTFDDGPDPVWTPAVLDALDRAGVPATFFVVGEKVSRYPQVVVDTLARGHSVQPHCWSHVAHEDFTRAQIEADIDQTLGVLSEIDIPTPVLWRPPFGRVKRPDTFEVAARKGLTLVGWSANSFDYRLGATGDVMLRELTRLGGPLGLGAWLRMARRRRLPSSARPGVSILLHDARIATPRTTCENTVELIYLLTALGRQRGWRFDHLSIGCCPDALII